MSETRVLRLLSTVPCSTTTLKKMSTRDVSGCIPPLKNWVDGACYAIPQWSGQYSGYFPDPYKGLILLAAFTAEVICFAKDVIEILIDILGPTLSKPDLTENERFALFSGSCISVGGHPASTANIYQTFISTRVLFSVSIGNVIYGYGWVCYR